MIESSILCSYSPILASTTIFMRPTASSFATPAPPGTALALRARASVRRTAGAVQVSSPVGTRPVFCAGSCPAAQASAHPFSRYLADSTRSNFPLASRVSRPQATPTSPSEAASPLRHLAWT